MRSWPRGLRHARHASVCLGELLDGVSELPVMSFDVGPGQWFEFTLAGSTQVTVAATAI